MNIYALARVVTLSTILMLGLAACRQAEDENTGQLEADAYLNVAEIYKNQGQFRAGIIEAQNALQAFPEYDKTRRFIAGLYIEMGDSVSAQTLLEQLLSANPEDSEAILLLAESQMSAGNPSLALETLEGLQPGSDAERIQAYWITGNAYARINNQVAAQEALNSALEINAEHTPSLVTLSILEFQAGNEFGSQQFLDRAIAADSTNLDMLIWQGQFASLREQYAESETAFFAALQIMGAYDTMTAKRMSVMRSIILPLQMQQKNDEALRYSQLIAESPQGQLQDSFTNAISMFQEGDYVQAEQAISSLLSQAPEHAGSNILLGMTQYAQGNFQGAEASLAGLVDAETSSPEVIKILAATHLRLGQPERALSTLQEAAALYPDDGSLLAMLAITEQNMGNIETSIELFQQAMDLEIESADLHFALAGSYFMIEDSESSIEQLQRALEIDPDYSSAKPTLINLLMNSERADEATALADDWLQQDAGSVINNNVAGRIDFNQSDLVSARSYFDTSLQLDRTNAESRLVLARRDIQEEDFSAAEEQFSQILANSPTNLEALSGLLALGDMSDTSTAKRAAISRIIEEQPAEFIPALVLAQYHLSRSEFSEALPYAETAYGRNVNDYTENTLLEVTVQLAVQARVSEDLDRAEELTAGALELQPENIQVLILAAGLESQKGAYSAAMLYIDRIKAAQPEDSTLGIELEGDLAAAQLQFETALTAFQQAWDTTASPGLGVKIHRTLNTLERPDEARQFLESWVADAPNESSVNLLLGMSFQENSEDDAAIDAYELAYLQEPDNIVALNNLAWLYQDSDPERAVELATRAAELYPENADVLDTYGWILLKQNDKDHAVQVLERALELAPTSAEIAEHLEQARQ
jgi:putative PEP-CTERM system TPR-repeat lipoprotein